MNDLRQYRCTQHVDVSRRQFLSYKERHFCDGNDKMGVVDYSGERRVELASGEDGRPGGNADAHRCDPESGLVMYDTLSNRFSRLPLKGFSKFGRIHFNTKRMVFFLSRSNASLESTQSVAKPCRVATAIRFCYLECVRVDYWPTPHVPTLLYGHSGKVHDQTLVCMVSL